MNWGENVGKAKCKRSAAWGPGEREWLGNQAYLLSVLEGCKLLSLSSPLLSTLPSGSSTLRAWWQFVRFCFVYDSTLVSWLLIINSALLVWDSRGSIGRACPRFGWVATTRLWFIAGDTKVKQNLDFLVKFLFIISGTHSLLNDSQHVKLIYTSDFPTALPLLQSVQLYFN